MDTDILNTVQVWATTQWNVTAQEVAVSIVARPVESLDEYVVHVTTPQSAVTAHLKPSDSSYHIYSYYPDGAQ